MLTVMICIVFLQVFRSCLLMLPSYLTVLCISLQQRQDDGLDGSSFAGFDDLMFTCAVTGWSRFDPDETQTCEGMSANGLSHEIQFTIDYLPPTGEAARARVPSFDLGEMVVRKFVCWAQRFTHFSPEGEIFEASDTLSYSRHCCWR